MSFYGEFTRAIIRNRVKLPSNFKKKMGEVVYFFLTYDSLLEIYPSVEGFKKEEFRYVYEVEVDRQGRVLIPKEIREKMFYCPCRIRFVGCKDYIKIELVPQS